MKNLRQLLRRSGLLPSPRRRGRLEFTARSNVSRRLGSEALERRELLAGDLLLAGDQLAANHNYWYPYDVNDDGQYSARDALAVINYMNSTGSAAGEIAAESDQLAMFYDVNADNRVTAADALGVINAMSRGEGVNDELIELFLNARTIDDQLIVPDGNGDVNVDVFVPFDLEISYEDRRRFGDGIGAFQLFTDIAVSQPDVLMPILNETQRLIIGEEFRQNTSGTLTFTLENSSATYVSQFDDFADDSRGEIVNAMTAFGYTLNTNYTLKSLDFGNDDFGFEIHYIGDEFGNLDLPDVTITSNFAVAVPTSTIEFAPFLADGVTVNTDAVRFNINTFSRTFNTNEKFYASQNRGEFDAATGFAGVGGLGGVPVDGGGIPDLTDDGSFPEPFDAYSLRVMIVSAVTDFVVGVNPGEDSEATLLYGRDLGVPQDLVLIDDDATVTFNATVVGGNNDPVVSAPVTRTFTEDDAVGTVNLLDNASDSDTGDTLSVSAPVVTGNQAGIVINGNVVTVTPAAYGALNTGQSEVINFTYNVLDGNGGTVAQTATITITGITDVVNQDPVVSAPVTRTFTEDDAVGTVNLLDNASDPDTGDTLSVSAPVVTGNQAGIVINGNVVTVTPAAYGALNTGQSEVINFTYNVLDGNGGTVAQTATITITGITDIVNQNPVVSAPVTATFTEDDAVGTVNLLDNASDPDTGDTLSISTPVVTGNQAGIAINGNVVTVTPAAYAALVGGASTQINFSYNVLDGNGGTVAQTATITITGVNKDPVVSAPVTAVFGENDGVGTVNLLDNASDPDVGDTLSISAPVVAGNQAGIAVNGNIVTVTPSAYAALNAGENEVITFTYNVLDDKGGTVAQTATITINGDNRNPVVSAPVSATFTEDDAVDTVNLLDNVSDPDSDALSISAPVVTGDQAGIAINGNIVTVTPSAYAALVGGQSSQVTFSYDVLDGKGGTVAQTASITITGVNRAPVVSAPVTASFSEDDANGTVNLLDNASDSDSDTLGVSGLTLVSGDASGITVNGSTLAVSPAAYGALTDGESAVIVYSYTVADGNGGTVAQSATVTINGVNDPPRARDDNGIIAFVDATQNINVLGNDDAGQDETQPLTVISAVSNDGNATLSINADGTVAFTPGAGFLGSTTFDYTIQDPGGLTDTATVSVTVQDFDPSSIAGSIFIDHVENIESVISENAVPIRNGEKDTDESGLGGVVIHLFSAAADNQTGQDINLAVLTNLQGGYSFAGIAPGRFTITATLDGEMISRDSDKVIYLGPSEQTVVIPVDGGVDVTGINYALLGTQGSALDTVDILASSYLRTNPGLGQVTNGGREGGLVSLAADGSQNFFIAGEGFEGVVFAELVLNDEQDSALLTILEEDGDVLTARLSADEFVVSSGDGLGVQFFGGMDDLSFVDATSDDLIRQEFARYRDAIDQVLGGSSV